MANENKVKHLFWRAGFGLSPNEWQQWRIKDEKEALDFILKTAQRTRTAAAPVEKIQLINFSELRKMSKEERDEYIANVLGEPVSQNVDWLKRMASEKSSGLLEKMTLFWHGHFACEPRQAVPTYLYFNTLRSHALGSFRDLVHEVAKDAAMIRYLNNQQNTKKSPNENFARELLELFTLGRGQYTEQDIKEAARAFTGWSSNLGGDFVFRKFSHDDGSKTFLGKTGNFGGEDIIDIILEKKETAQFIVRKIYKYFVHDSADEDRVHTLAARFFKSDYDITDLMQAIFSSEWFYDPENMGVRVKSPVELLAGYVRALKMDFTDPKALFILQKSLGQVLFNPPNVAGWPGGLQWIDHNSLLLRVNLPFIFFQLGDWDVALKEEPEMERLPAGLRKLEASMDLQPFLDLLKGIPEKDHVGFLASFLLNVELPANLLKSRFLQEPSKSYPDRVKDIVMYLMGLPEYQVC